MAAKAKPTEQGEPFPDPNRAGDGPAATQPPSLPRREAWLDVEPEEYPRFRMRVWLGMSEGTRAALESTGDAQREALAKVFLEHCPGCTDEEGAPLPPLSDAAFWSAIPTRLAYLMLRRLNTELYSRPKSQTRNGSSGG